MKKSNTAALANRLAYDAMREGEYMCGAPHLSHDAIRNLYEQIVHRAYNIASQDGRVPTVLDLGAGDGIATIPFLSLGAYVTAVDISSRQLDQLRERCVKFGQRIDVRCGDVFDIMKDGRKFDIVVANSFLHHVPDYMSLIEAMTSTLSEGGVIMTFQDPMLYKSCSFRDSTLTQASYFFWRIRQKEVLSGLVRRIRRGMGIFHENSIHDNAEYHVVRDGVNQVAIRELLIGKGFNCSILEYGSFMSNFWQKLGDKLEVKNTFAVLANRYGEVESIGLQPSFSNTVGSSLTGC